jgi:signal transduction histidine kinase
MVFHHSFLWPAVWLSVTGTLGWSCLARAIEPILLTRPEATFHSGVSGSLETVIDGVDTGPQGWSVAPKVHEPQALVVRCARPVEAAELDVTLFFMAGRPMNTIAEFALSYTTDPEPSLSGNWKLLEIVKFNAQVTTLRRTEDGHLRSDPLPFYVTGMIPDDVYRATVLLPGGRATGFRLEVFPVKRTPKSPPGLSWYPGFNFWLTEFRVEVHTRETTNIALHRPVKASHTLFIHRTGESLQASALTDGLPATIAHPDDPTLGANFFFEVDLGRVAALDHIGLRNRGDIEFDRLSRVWLRLYDNDPSGAAAPAWEGINRADGSHPAEATVDIVRPDIGKGIFHGRYLRLSSDSPVPLSPQLAEVEVYESRVPELVSVLVDGREIPLTDRLEVPPGVRRLALRLRIPQEGLPPGVSFRWRVPGELDAWQDSRLMSIDMACPMPGKTVFEAQALHSDGQWDATIYRLPIHTGRFFWQAPVFRWSAGIGIVLLAVGLGVILARRRAGRKLALMKMESALADERRRIARDIHDDLGSSLTRISIVADGDSAAPRQPARMESDLATIHSVAKEMVLTMDQIVWAVNPQNDSLEALARYLADFAEEFLEPTGLRLRLDLPIDLPAWPLPSRLRHNLFLAFKEALNNTVKHAAAHEVEVTLRIEDRRIRIAVRDDGRSFASPHTAGNGLDNMRVRLESLGGTCRLTSNPGQGTTVEFELQVLSTQPQT